MREEIENPGVPEPLAGLRIDRERRSRAVPARRRRRVALLAAVAVLAAGIAALAATRPPSVAVAQVREARPGEEATALTASGYVASRRRSVVAPRIAGRLRQLLVQEGQEVQAGEVVARLDDDDARVAVSQAEARARAAAAQLADAEAQSAKARRDLADSRVLAARGVASRQELKNALTTEEAVAARRGAAGAELAAARQAAAATRLTLEHTVIRAPFTGTVVRKLADEGAVLAPAALDQPNTGGIIELVDLGQLEVEAEVSEDQLARVRHAEPALIFLDAYPRRTFRGQAATVRPAIDRAKGTAVVKVDFRPQPRGVFPGMAARVSFLERPVDEQGLRTEPRLRVPAAAVVERDGRAVVLTIEGGRVHAVPVQPAERRGNEVALHAGPRPGTRIVAAPGPKLRDGARVRVAEGR
ncbi:MAG TPA: efflux RND transporter periplasmic adaptor subunit [Polyangia bacterium]